MTVWHADEEFTQWVESKLGINLTERKVTRIEIDLEIGHIPTIRVTEMMMDDASVKTAITSFPLEVKRD